MHGGKRDRWVFAYGSLMWEPGFDYEESQPALLRGYHRSFCMYSWHYRGTIEAPGLVLGLDAGGSCRGLAFRVAGARAEEVFAYLHQREMIHHIYLPKDLKVQLPGPRAVRAHTYVADRSNAQYTGKLSLDRTAALIRQGRGSRGDNVEYLENTVRRLDELGVPDGPLHRVLARVRAASKTGGSPL